MSLNHDNHEHDAERQARVDRMIGFAFVLRNRVTDWMRGAWVRTSRRHGIPASRRPPPGGEGDTRRVPAEYLPLYSYLEHRYASIVVLTFEQMEALLGFALPAPATTERDWWMGVALRASTQSAAWVGAGRTATPNLAARTVTFERVP